MKARLLALVCLTFIAACGSAPLVHFHSLLNPPGALTAPSPIVSRWELLPVTVPAQVDQPQWLVRMPDETLALLENERWAAPLAEELRAALSDRLRAQMPPAAQTKAWRIAVDVRRFESLPGRYARLETEWMVSELESGIVRLRCRNAFEQASAHAYPALAAAHRALVNRLGDVLAASLQRLDAGAAPVCI
jgi:hypothetical protein